MDQKPKILIVDDSAFNQEMLSEILEEQYEIIKADNGLEGLQVVEKDPHGISLILLDYYMPHMNGFEFLKIMKQRGWLSQIPIIMITAESDGEFIDQAYGYGIFDFIVRPFNVSIVRHRVENTILAHAKQKRLQYLVRKQVKEQGKQSDMLINILSHIVEFRNEESGQHVLNVRQITKVLLKKLTEIDPQLKLDNETIEQIALASSLHDVGKITLPSKILNKPSRLDPEEFEQIKKHAKNGYDILNKVPNYRNEPLMIVSKQIARWHHERFDGSGYPDGLKGSEIPISAQVVAIADVYDALTMERVYKKAFPPQKAIDMILNGECGCFNPLLLQVLKDPTVQKELKEIVQMAKMEVISDRREILDLCTDPILTPSLRDDFAAEALDLISKRDQISSTFYSEKTQEIRFEISLDPMFLTISPSMAKKYEIPSSILDPQHDPLLLEKLGKENIDRILHEIECSKGKVDDIDFNFSTEHGGEPHWWRIILHPLYHEKDPKDVRGYLGLLLDIHSQKMTHEMLERSASIDELTGLLNKNYTQIQVKKRLEEADEMMEYAIAILDLDFFKNANDEYGHAFGDEVLAYLAKRIQGSIRKLDIAGRIGGDEFLIMLQYPGNLETIMDRIFHTISSGSYKGFPISISMGVASTEYIKRNFDDLFNVADFMLYEAKRSGRGCLKIYKGE
ncbi:bifunctional diguanylate cyclase/phosphohydrolase [Dubosiella newyorkensis]|uniref:bifunctional diguanylate cyclase/phosphohydrolase n=1 Tax=Dubosiella newyorkensis TaxID=1862672 RepID=UPI00258A5E80|nr:diguanylate cyclase [Dubosiella newyorkensis]